MAPSIRDFLNFQLKQMQKHGPEAAGDQLWTNLKQMLKAIPGYLEVEDSTLQAWCSKETARSTVEGFQEKQWDPTLCKMLSKLILWMNGRNQNGEKQQMGMGTSEGEDMELMFRCIAGNVVIWAMFGNHCLLKMMLEYTAQAVDAILLAFFKQGEDRKCGHHDFSQIRIGAQLLGTLVKGWVDENKKNLSGYSTVKDWEDKVCQGNSNKIIPGSGVNGEKSKMKEITGYGQKEMQEIKEVVENEEFLTESSAKELIGKVKNDELNDDTDLGNVVQQKVKEDQQKKAALAASKAGVQLDKGEELNNGVNRRPEVKLDKGNKPDNGERKLDKGGKNLDKGGKNLDKGGKYLDKGSDRTRRNGTSRKDCSKETDLCVRAKCVTTQWGENRVYGGSTPWNLFWVSDVKRRLDPLSIAMTNKTKEDHELCKELEKKGGTTSEANKKACNFIVRGLEHIYKIEKGKVQENDRKDPNREAQKKKEHADNQIFHRTMSCVLLNAFADKLIERTNGHMCPITEEIIQEMFKEGNRKSAEWCRGKNKEDEDMNCEVCERKPNLTCQIGDKNEYNVKNEVDNLFNGEHGTNIQKTLTDINSINNTLCARAQCVTTKWFKNRINAAKDKQDWCTFWGEQDVGKVLKDLSTAMKNGKTVNNNLCEGIKVTNGTPSEANKKACNFIVRGLEDIYKKEPYGHWTHKVDEEKNKDNQQFYRTVGCIILNLYADKLEKQPCISKEVIDQAFGLSDQIKKGTLCNNDPNCVECTREKSYSTCTLSVKTDLLDERKSQKCEEDRKNIRNKLDRMLNDNQHIKTTLTTINNASTLCQGAQCVTKKWSKNRSGKPESEAWEDVKGYVGGLSGDIITNESIVGSYCNIIKGQDSKIVTDTEKKACRLIGAGLKHIYEIKADVGNNTPDEKRKAEDDRLFKQTMLCLLLNAYADKLEREVKAPCKVDEQTIAQAFEKGNENKDNWCVEKKKGGDCVECKREPNLKCTIGAEKVEEKLKPMLDTNDKITKTVTTMSTLSSNLCQRSQCVISQWTRDKREEEKGKTKVGEKVKEIWETHIWDGMKGKIDPLAEAISKEDLSMQSYCNDVDEGAKKAACKQIVSGLMHVYKTQVEQSSETSAKGNNKIFHQTMKCAFLNVYADTLKELPCKPEEGVNKAFDASGTIMGTACSGGDCEVCKMEPDLNCTGGRKKGNIWNTVKEKLDGNQKIQNALKKICPPPAKVPEVPKAAETNAHQPEIGSTRSDVTGNDIDILPTLSTDWIPPNATLEDDDDGLPTHTEPLGSPQLYNLLQQVTKTLLPLVQASLNLLNPHLKQEQFYNLLGNKLNPLIILKVLLDPVVQEAGILVLLVLVWLVSLEQVSLWSQVQVFQGLLVLLVIVYFALGKKRRRHRREEQLTSPPLQEQLLSHVDDHLGQHEYTLIKERKQPRYVPKGRKREDPRRRVAHRTIIDIHLEVLDEYQRGDKQLAQKDFFEILVQEFMGSEFIKEENVPKENVSKEQVPSLDYGFRVDVPKENVPKEMIPEEVIPKEQVLSSDFGFRDEERCS
ncbi:SICA antigen [Plasmodium coatneyi]|uniref:SICA antigen n=1 Tax=Plasmodium coatneyi TaxID=208452 RepID=A0A1B1DZE0_9APIC|nr:SICA antigen [Plasmodium coatneyi]ANQ08128.1 SICA antigen [Plasmodium coatneyi]